MFDTISPAHHRLRRLKAALLAVSFTLVGILLMMLNAWLSPLRLGDWQWLHALPLGELGGTLFGAGLLSTFFEYAFRRDQERAVTERFRQKIRDEAPALRDAVIEAFRFDRQDVARIATPQLLDDLARTSLGLRFGDPAFGREVYADIRHQAMAAEERWYDARVDATLGIPRGRSIAPTPFFDLRVRWEYTVTPRRRFRKFAVDGVPVPFTRQVEDAGQIYVVDLGTQVITDDKPVVIAFRFRSLVPRNGHVFHLNIDRPTKGLDVELSYDADAIERVRLMDFASRGDGGRVSEEPQSAVVRYRYDGWLFPRAGLVFAWTFHNEQVAQLDQAADAQPRANASQRTSAGQRTGIAKSSVSAGNDDARPAQAA